MSKDDYIVILEIALNRIATWHGESPPTSAFYDKEKTRRMSYGTAYGSNGERDYMRRLAAHALSYK